MPKKALNINGLSVQLCGCGSGLDHWEKVCGRKARMCSEVNCSDPAALGGYVMKEGGDRRWYVIPLCRGHHAMQGKDLEVAESTTFVPAEAGAVCSRE
jgi:hypothetical protein